MINYYLLTKPGIILGNLITVAAGFLLASKGEIDFRVFFATLVGLAFIIASACVFNNYIDRQIDQKMERTKHRPLAAGLIRGNNAIIFAMILGILGCLVLLVYTNLLTLFVSGVGFFVYVFLYSLWKCRTIYGTAVGSIAGAIPPVVGYCAAGNHFDFGALILFAMLVLWQMPHFFSIAIYHYRDYVAARIPVLPVERGILRTKVHMVMYIIGFILVALMLTFFNYTGYLYLYVIMSIGLLWLVVCMIGFRTDDNQRWGRHMFYTSLLMIAATCLVMSFDINLANLTMARN